MSVQHYSAKLAEKENISDRLLYLHFELVQPHRIDFDAGQYILMDIPGLEEKRQYSIASIPEMDHAIELLVDITPYGKGSKYLNNLEPGDEVSFRAPIGVFTLAPISNSSELVFIATGSGISPLRSMIHSLLITQNENQLPIKLFWGMRQEQDLFWEEEFYELSQQHSNFKFELILSQPSPEWHLSKGYVTDLLEAFQHNYTSSEFYICGSTQMITSVKDYLLEKGAGEAHIHHEKFY